MTQEPAAFDDSRKALTFALNAHVATMPQAFMNKAMAAAPVPKPRRKKGDTTELPAPPDVVRRTATTQRPLQGLDRAGQAGMILAQFERLDDAEKCVLRGLLITAYHPCGCSRPCCSGWTPNMRWLQAVSATCDYLRDAADVAKVKGKRGLSTLPALRVALVQEYLTRRGQSLTDMARIADVTLVTAAKHRDWIYGWLDATEQSAWISLDLIFDQAGITGAKD